MDESGETTVIVSLFDYSGNMVLPWAEAGYECVCYDIKHDGTTTPPHKNIRFAYADLSTPIPLWDKVEFMAAFPPCDHLAVSGARWFQGKGLRALAGAIELFATAAEMCERSGAPYMIENPVSTISTYWRKPDYRFDPCDYGDPYTKKTCLWTGGGFVMPVKNPVEPTEGSKMHFVSPGPERATIRSMTPMGFARAVFAANRRF